LGDILYLDTLKKRRGLSVGAISPQTLDMDEVELMVKRGLKNATRRVYDSLILDLVDAMSKRVKSLSEPAMNSPLEKKFQSIAQTLDLDKVELKLVKLLFMLETNRALDSYLDDSLEAFTFLNRSLLVDLLEASRQEVMAALSGRLVKMDFIDEDLNSKPRLDDSFYRLLEFPDSPASANCFTTALPPILGEKDFFFDTHTMTMLRRFLTSPSRTPNHILFYGPPGVGKTQLARFLASGLSGQAFEVKPEASDNSHRTNLLISHNYLKAEPGRVLIIDEADKLLESSSRGGFLFFSGSDKKGEKAWLDYFMEKKGPSCLWIVNDESFINPSVIRRFSFSVKFEPLGTQARLRIWRSQRDGAGNSFLSEDSMRSLAKDYNISPAIIAQSFEKTLEIGPDSEETANVWIKKQLNAHLELSGHLSPAPKVPPQYRLDAVVTNPPIGEFLPELKKWREHCLVSPVEERRGQKLLFHGPPGVGKTELANYLAQELDLDISRARSSDIISPYVGRSEINLAELFRRYENTLGVVLIDEVESFLYNRDKALRTWEMSLVNEFLTCLDRFTGLFICTTNRPDDLDPAARRRLGRKVEFSPLNQSGRIELFESFLTPLSGQGLSEGEIKRLELLSTLVPSDYAMVADTLAYSTSVDNLSLLVALENEANSRLRTPQQGAPQTERVEPKPKLIN
jgi:SpoVK/Ycf46/Vps4 family AAA+-type ATPase